MVLSDRDYSRRMLQTVLTVAGTIILLTTLWMARSSLLLIYISALIAMGLAPIVSFIERADDRSRKPRVPRWLAILVLYLAIMGAFALVALTVIPPLVSQAEALWEKLPDEFSRLQSVLIHYKVMQKPVTLVEAVQSAPKGAGENAVGTVLAAIWSIGGGLFGLVTTLILSFYLLLEAERMMQYISRFIPASRRVDVSTAARQAVAKVSAWLRAQFVLSGVMGVFAAVGLGLMGVPYFFVVALVAAVGEAIPMVGPLIGGATAVIVSIGVSPKLALIVAAYFLVLHQLESNILVPKLMEKRVGVSPVVVMVALLIGAQLWGLLGAILAVPTAAIISIIIEEIAADREIRLQRVR
jgi:predicted PurR-regulated permease PerM